MAKRVTFLCMSFGFIGKQLVFAIKPVHSVHTYFIKLLFLLLLEHNYIHSIHLIIGCRVRKSNWDRVSFLTYKYNLLIKSTFQSSLEFIFYLS